MKTIRLSLILALTLLTAGLYAQPLHKSLQEAVEEGMVELTLEGTGMGYYQNSLQIKARNLTDFQLMLELNPGSMMDSDDPFVQDLVVVEMFVMNVSPRGQNQQIAQAMCVQMHNGAPSHGDTYKMRGHANNKLNGLANLISEKKWHNVTAQAAVWVISDRAPITNINGDSLMVSTLQRYLTDAYGLTSPEPRDVYIPEYMRPGKGTIKPEEAGTPAWALPGGRKSAATLHEEEMAKIATFNQPRSSEIREREYVPIPGSKRFYTLQGELICDIPGAGEVRVAFFGPDGKEIRLIGTKPATQASTTRFKYNFTHQVVLKGRYKIQAIQGGKVLAEQKFDLE